MTTVKEENGNASLTDHQPNTQNATTYTAYSSTGATAARKRKTGRGEESLTQQTRRKSSRRSVAPKTLLEEVSAKLLPRQQATHPGTWKAEELEILLDCLKTYVEFNSNVSCLTARSVLCITRYVTIHHETGVKSPLGHFQFVVSRKYMS